ncbi:MAG: TIGR01777 family oxidoreductase [Acidimicrobiales bacterium]
MRVLVSGSHGLIGGALSRRLTGNGHTVVPLVRPGSPRPGSPRPGSPRPGSPRTGGAPSAGTQPGPQPSVSWDPTTGAVDLAALRDHGPYDAVVHLAGAGIGERRWTPSRRDEIMRSRVEPTRLLAETLAGSDPRPPVLVSASAIGFYGDRGDHELTEDDAGGQGFLADVCRAWESATAPADDALRVVHLRTGVVLSTQGGALAKQLPLFRLGIGGRLGSGKQYLSWITLEDELAVIERMLTDDRLVGPVNAVAPEPVTNSAFTAALASALHRPALLPVPRSALAAVLGRDMATELLVTGQRVLPSRLSEVGHTFAHSQITGALDAVLLSRT